MRAENPTYEYDIYCTANINVADVRLGINPQTGRFQVDCTTSKARIHRTFRANHPPSAYRLEYRTAFGYHLSDSDIIYHRNHAVACSPGGSSSNVFSMLAKGDVALSVTLTACSSLITLFTLPLIMAWVTKSVGETADIELPVGNLLIQNIVLMVIPIAIGFTVNMFREKAAGKIHNVLKRITMPALILLVTVFFFQHKQTIVDEFASLGLTMTVLILACTGCGTLLSWLLHLSAKERRTLVIEIGMQNAAQAITIACSPLIFNNEVIAIPAIIYALMMNLILLAYVGITKFH